MEVSKVTGRAPCGAKLGEAMALGDFVEPKIRLLPTPLPGRHSFVSASQREDEKPQKSFLLRAKRNSSMPG